MARFRCYSCDKSLDGHPKIQVEGSVYCYYCAKQTVNKLDYAAELKEASERRDHDKAYEKWKAWNDSRESALPSVRTQVCVILGTAVACAVLLANPIFFILPGLIVGFIANQIFFSFKKKNWVGLHPEPHLPAMPKNDFVRNKIQLLDGDSGRRLPGRYQKRILERDGYRCQICGELFAADDLEVHHIKPQAAGGSDYATNLITECWRCHRDEIWFGHRHKYRQRSFQNLRV